MGVVKIVNRGHCILKKQQDIMSTVNIHAKLHPLYHIG